MITYQGNGGNLPLEGFESYQLHDAYVPLVGDHASCTA